MSMTAQDRIDLLEWLEARRERMPGQIDPQVAFLPDGRMCCPRCMTLSVDCRGHKSPPQAYKPGYTLPVGWQWLAGRPFAEARPNPVLNK